MNRYVPVLNQTNTSFKQWSEEKYHQKKINKVKKIILVSLLWTLIFAYLISPFSRAQIQTTSGNLHVLTNEDLYEIGDFSANSYWWSVDVKKIESKLLNYDYVSSVDVNQTPLGLQIDLVEIVLVGTNGDVDNTVYFLSNGESKYKSTIVFNDIGDYDGKHLQDPETNGVPIIDKTGFSETQFDSLCSQMGNIPSSILTNITSISLNSNFTEFTAINVEISKDLHAIDANLNIVIDISCFDLRITSTIIATICQFIKEEAPEKIDGRYCYVVLDTMLDETTCYPCLTN